MAERAAGLADCLEGAAVCHRGWVGGSRPVWVGEGFQGWAEGCLVVSGFRVAAGRRRGAAE